MGNNQKFMCTRCKSIVSAKDLRCPVCGVMFTKVDGQPVNVYKNTLKEANKYAFRFFIRWFVILPIAIGVFFVLLSYIFRFIYF